jgi:hypothetical protein
MSSPWDIYRVAVGTLRVPAGTMPAVLVAVGAALVATSAAAQTRPAANTVVTAAGERYRAGPLHRWILGRHYRDLWTTPVEVEVLDLDAFAGGLEPLRTGGGMQTRSLRFLGADGREYAFRSVDKDPSPVLDSLLWDTFVDDLVQDGISAAHPYGALVAPPLLDAAGVLHVEPQLRVMPDDPSLGEFRAEFAGMLGMIEERPDENEGQRSSFAGTRRVIASETLVERLARGPQDRIDARAFLRARLVDVFLGDWDRHRGQWRWASFDDEPPRRWRPVPTDRDQAFSKFDGLATRVVSLYMPQFVRFEEDYPSITRLHWNARDLDRWFLSGLERPAWDSIGSDLVARLDDAAIERAVARLPPEIRALNGAELTATLLARRAGLAGAWDAFYRLLARRVDVRLSNADDLVTVERSAPDKVRVSAAESTDSEPHFDRTFIHGETEEVRVYLEGGNDRLVVLGGGENGTLVRVIGGPGNDTFEIRDRDRRVRLYDSEGDDAAMGEPPPSIDRRHFEEWIWSEESRDQPRDWGRRVLPVFWSSYASDVGPFVGGGAALQSYGFRKRPFASALDLRAGLAPALGKWRFELQGRVNTESSPVFVTTTARLSRLDILHYYGLGNDSRPAGDRGYHRVDQTAASVGLGLGVALGTGVELRGGVLIERLSTRDGVGRFYGSLGPVYGGGQFVQMSGVASLDVDPLADSETTAHRVRLAVSGALFPAMLDAERGFGRVAAELSLLLARSPSPRVSLALRAAGEEVWGRLPWHQAAFLGGTGSLNGWNEQRFAGDLAVSGGAEVRARLWRPRVVVPTSLGVFAFADAGRVYLDGASPGGWHSSTGGGIWLQPVQQPYMLRAGVGVGAETTMVFVTLGLPY